MVDTNSYYLQALDLWLSGFNCNKSVTVKRTIMIISIMDVKNAGS